MSISLLRNRIFLTIFMVCAVFRAESAGALLLEQRSGCHTSFVRKISKLLRSPFSAFRERSPNSYEARALSIGYASKKPLSANQHLQIKQGLSQDGTAVVLVPPLFDRKIARKVSNIILSDLSMNIDYSMKEDFDEDKVPFYWDKGIQNSLRWYRGNRYKKDIAWLRHKDTVTNLAEHISWEDFKALLSRSGRISEEEIALFEENIFAFIAWLGQMISDMEGRSIRPSKFFLRTQNGLALPSEGHNHQELINTSVWISSTYAIQGPGTWFQSDDPKKKFITPDQSALLLSEPARNMVLFPEAEKSLPYHGNPYDMPGDRLLLVSFFEAIVSPQEDLHLKKRVMDLLSFD